MQRNTTDSRAISLGVSALIVIALILIVGFAAFLNGTFNNSSSITTRSNTNSVLSIPTLMTDTTETNQYAIPCSTTNSSGILLTPSSYLFMNAPTAEICLLYTLSSQVSPPLSESFSGQVFIGHVYANGSQRLSAATSYGVSASPKMAIFASANSTIEVTYTITGTTGNVYFLPIGFCSLVPISHSSNAASSELPFFPIGCPVGLSAKMVGASNLTLLSLNQTSSSG